MSCTSGLYLRLWEINPVPAPAMFTRLRRSPRLVATLIWASLALALFPGPTRAHGTVVCEAQANGGELILRVDSPDCIKMLGPVIQTSVARLSTRASATRTGPRSSPVTRRPHADALMQLYLRTHSTVGQQASPTLTAVKPAP